MIIYCKRDKSTCITRNDNIVEMLFYFFERYLKQKIIALYFNHLIMLAFCFIKNKWITNKVGR